MNIRKKTVFTFLAVFISMSLLTFLISYVLIFNNLEGVERKEVDSQLKTEIDLLNSKIDGIDRICLDWGSWDDTYQFVYDKNNQYIVSTLNDETISNLSLNFVIYLSEDNNVIYSKFFDLESNKEISAPAKALENIINPILSLIKPKSGLIIVSGEPVLVSYRDILTSTGAGPSRGTLIMGQYYTEDLLYSGQEDFKTVVYPIEVANKSEQWNKVNPKLQIDGVAINTGADLVSGYSYLKDIYGSKTLVIQTDIPRTTYQQGRQQLLLLTFISIFIGIIFGAIFFIFVEREIVSRISDLSSDVSTLSLYDKNIGRLREYGNDEIGNLTKNINHMLASIENSKKVLMESEEKYRNIVETSPDGIAVVDLKDIIKSYNSSFLDIIDIPNKEVIGRSFTGLAFLSKNNKERYINNLKYVLKGNLSKSFEVDVEGDNPKTIDVLLTPVKEHDEIVGVQIIARNITDNKKSINQLEKDLEKMSTLVDNLKSPLSILSIYADKQVPDEKIAKIIQERITKLEDAITKISESISETEKIKSELEGR